MCGWCVHVGMYVLHVCGYMYGRCMHVAVHVCFACVGIRMGGVCMWLCMYVLHVCGYTHGRGDLWKPKTDVGNHPPLLFHFVHWDRMSQSNPDLTATVGLSSQLDSWGPPPAFQWAGHHTHLTLLWVSRSPKLQASSSHANHFYHGAIRPAPSSPHKILKCVFIID